jgi:hypothetical protein
LATALVVTFLGADAALAAEKAEQLQTVEFIHDTVLELHDRVLKLLGGTSWLLEYEPLVVPMQKVVIVTLPGKRSGALYLKGGTVVATLVDGAPFRKTGRLGFVVRSLGKGAVLELNDGSLWEVPHYDQYDTGWWLPPYPVIITSDQMYMFNLKEGKKVWVNPAR